VRPGWIRSWHDAFGSGRLELVALRREGRLVALAPLERAGGLLRSPTNWHTPEFALLAEDAPALERLAAELVASSPRRLQLAFAPADGGVEETARVARAARYRVLRRVLERSPYVPVEADWETYCAGLNRKDVKEIRRKRRRLEEEGELTFELADGSDRLDELLQQGFRIEGSGWKEENGTAILSRPETRRFYTEISRWAQSRGWLRLAFLRLDGRPIAFELTLRTPRRHYVLKGGYEEEFRRFGPGMLITEELVRNAFETGAESYEFLGSDETFKLVWTDRRRDRLLLQAFAPTPAGLGDWAAYAFGRPLAKRVLALRRRS
jgi:CelD/BcsL family acetyltransferase involved in cellulose biosynthesis